MISLKTETVVHQWKANSNLPSSQGVLGQLYNAVNRIKGSSLSTRPLGNKGLNKSQMSREKAGSDSLLWTDDLAKFPTRGKPKHHTKRKRGKSVYSINSESVYKHKIDTEPIRTIQFFKFSNQLAFGIVFLLVLQGSGIF